MCFKVYAYEEVEKKGKISKPKHQYIESENNFDDNVPNSKLINIII